MSNQPTLRVVKGDGWDTPPITGEGFPPPCLHEHLKLNATERRVTCRGCDAEIDPYEALFNLARHFDHFIYASDRLRAERDALRRSVENLKRIESNAKARIRTAIKSAPSCVCEQPARYGRFCRDCGGRVVREQSA